MATLDATWYGLRTGWSRTHTKVDLVNIPSCLPKAERAKCLADYARYSFCYDLGDGARLLLARREVQAVITAATTVLLAWIYLKLGLPTPA